MKYLDLTLIMMKYQIHLGQLDSILRKYNRGWLFKVNESLVNVWLKFKTFILQIHCYFWLEKVQKILTFFQQKIIVYLIHILNELTS